MLEVRTVDSGLEMSGALDHDGGRKLLRVVSGMRGDVRIDASRVQRLDGAGLTALAVARQQCLADGRDFVVTAIAPEAMRGLRVGGRLADVFGPRPPSSADIADAAAPDHVALSGVTDGGAPPRAMSPRRFRVHFHLHRHHRM